MKRVYLDYASTTPLDARVRRVMEPFFKESFGNPSSIHTEGAVAKKALDGARTSVARSLEAHADEIVFTSGGTEANNLAIFGILSTLYPLSSTISKPHVVTTNIEHASVLEPLRRLERQGTIEVTYVPVESNGIVSSENIISAIRPNTVLVSVMYANNEIGTIQPVAKIGKAIKQLREGLKSHIRYPKKILNSKSKILNSRGKAYPLFHVDACQAPLYLHCLVNALGVDLLSLDAHKICGPKGVGALYMRRGTSLTPLLFGGGQERGIRSTTENIPAIVGFAQALLIAVSEREKESARVGKLRDYLCAALVQGSGAEIMLNGSMKQGERLPNNLNFSLLGVDTEFLTLQLDANGVSVSTKSSCLKDEKNSYVISALGGGIGRSSSSLRCTLGRWTTKAEILSAVNSIKRLI